MAVTAASYFVGVLISIVSSCISALIIARYNQVQTQCTPHPELSLLSGVCQGGILGNFESSDSSALIQRRPCGWQRNGDEAEAKFGIHANHPCALQQSAIPQDPSSTLFVLACVTYCLAISVLYRHSKDGIYHLLFLAAGVIIACVAGVYHAMDIQSIILSYLPGGVTAALTLSVIVSAIQRSWENANKALTQRHYELVRGKPLWDFKEDLMDEEKKDLRRIVP